MAPAISGSNAKNLYDLKVESRKRGNKGGTRGFAFATKALKRGKDAGRAGDQVLGDVGAGIGAIGGGLAGAVQGGYLGARSLCKGTKHLVHDKDKKRSDKQLIAKAILKVKNGNMAPGLESYLKSLKETGESTEPGEEMRIVRRILRNPDAAKEIACALGADKGNARQVNDVVNIVCEAFGHDRQSSMILGKALDNATKEMGLSEDQYAAIDSLKSGFPVETEDTDKIWTLLSDNQGKIIKDICAAENISDVYQVGKWALKTLGFDAEHEDSKNILRSLDLQAPQRDAKMLEPIAEETEETASQGEGIAPWGDDVSQVEGLKKRFILKIGKKKIPLTPRIGPKKETVTHGERSDVTTSLLQNMGTERLNEQEAITDEGRGWDDVGQAEGKFRKRFTVKMGGKKRAFTPRIGPKKKTVTGMDPHDVVAQGSDIV